MSIFKRYLRVICSIYALLLLFRLIETALVFYKYGFGFDILLNEAKGLGYDILGVGTFVIGYFLVYFLLSKIKLAIANAINIALLLLASLLFFVNTGYFLYQLEPLGIFLYTYSFEEIYFTIRTSNTSFLMVGVALFALLAMVAGLVWYIHKIQFSRRVEKLIYTMVLLSLPIYATTIFTTSNKTNPFTLNKTFYFTYTSIEYGLSTKSTLYNTGIAFQKLYPHKNFISQDYPLTYKIDRKNVLKPYFETFDSPPNIVILITEGLNDDFIHEYKGAMFMPFLHQLKNKSLYWKRFFTLGERSYAVVPSLLGGLPYGDIGFTLQDRLPRHTSLVSVLNTNHYHTAFYYGQGAWFHKKDRFFKHNDIDLILDDRCFSDNYKKIIVGKNHFFWGYNDKALFDQSFRIIDTISKSARLDIYFTGTMHGPFLTDPEPLYTKKLKALTPQSYAAFYTNHSQHLKTLLFFDDALKDFFEVYKQRPDYNNTIFIITGDHPMTEMPIANSLKRYHVPLIIFSEKLKTAHTFSETASHLDVSESLLSFLADYIDHVPQISTSLGEHLLDSTNTPKNIVFMNYNRDVVDFLYGDYYLSEGVLYKVDSTLDISISDNEKMKSMLTQKLNTFANTSLYITRKNKLISPQMYCTAIKHTPVFIYQNTDSATHISTEFFNIVHSIPMTNTKQIFDVSFNISGADKRNISLVYQVNNAKDSTLLWQSVAIDQDKIIQDHLTIKPFQHADSLLYFSVHLWNKDKTPFEVSDIDALLHTPPNTN